jgi:hypothetical protein
MRITLGGSLLTLGDSALSLGATVAVRVYRGDDGGELERYWRKWAEKWVEDKLGEIEDAKTKPRKVRKRLAAKIREQAAEYEVTAPELAPRIDDLQIIAGWLAAPEPDLTAIAAEVMEQRAILDAWNLKQRRRRDMEALLILAA